MPILITSIPWKCDIPEIPERTKIPKRANKSLKKSQESIAHGKNKNKKNTINMEVSSKQVSNEYQILFNFD